MNIAVLVSGGVDSSVALQLLHEQGHTITAFYLKIWLEDELSYLGSCPWEEDLGYIRALCERLKIPLEVVPLQREYAEAVVAYVIEEVKAGRTPNPDLLCNKEVKFGAFYRHIDSMFDKVATGHYAQVIEQEGLFLLKRAPDIIKDQTYFLARLNQGQLSRALFPIGHLQKYQVREYAMHYRLPAMARKDSQGICFLGKISFAEFLEYHVGTREGLFVEYETGKVMGKHKGFWFFTIGQRQGIGLAGGPWYVVKKECTENTVYISRHYHDLTALRESFIMTNCHWIAGRAPAAGAVDVKVRHGAALHHAQLRPLDDGTYYVQLATPDQGIASGQFAVLYQDDICLGSGTMVQVDQEKYEI